MLRAAPTSRPWLERLCRSTHSRAIVCFIAVTAVIVVMSWPLITGRVFCGDDLGAYHLPARHFYANALQQGESFDWWPDIYCGFYLTGEGQAGTYHPWHWLLYRTLPLAVAFDIEVLSVYPFLFVGTYLFLQQLVRRRDAAAFGALVFTFGSFNLLHLIQINAVAVVSHLPWLLWGLGRLREESKTGRPRTMTLVALALLTASQILLGYPQYVWFTALAEMAYLASTVRSWQTVGIWTVCKAIGGVIGAVQLLPTADALANSTRQAVSNEFVNSGAWHPLNVLQFIAPYAFQSRAVGQNTHELGAYCGAVALALVVWLLGNRSLWGRQRKLILGTMAFGLLSIALATGEHLGIYRLQAWLPVVGKFRFPCRAIVLAQLAIAVLAAVAAFTMLRAARWQRESTLRPLWILTGFSALCAVVIPVAWPEHAASWAKLMFGPVAIAVAGALVAGIVRGNTKLWPALVLLGVGDLAAYGLSYSVFPQTLTWAEYATPAHAPPCEAGQRIVVAAQPGQHVGNRVTVAGWKRADGYAGLEPAKQLNYALLKPAQVSGTQCITSTGRTIPPTAAGNSASRWQPVEHALNRATLFAHCQVSGDPARDLNNIDPLHTALNETEVDIEASATGVAAVSADRPGLIAVATECTGTMLLMVNESWHSGWQVIVNGRPATLCRCYGDFIGCIVPAGVSRVEFAFRPTSLTYGKRGSAAGLCLLLGMLVWNSRRH